MMRLEGNRIFQAVISNNQIINVYCRHLGELDAAIKQKQLKLANRKRCCIPSRQCQIAHKFGRSPEAVTTWMGCVTTLIIFS